MDASARIRIAFDDGNETEITVAEFREANNLFPEMVGAACVALDRGETYRDGGGAGPAFTVDLVSAAEAGEATDLPDISEIVEVIREVVLAADAYKVAHPEDETTADDMAGRAWVAAFARLQTLLTEIDAAVETFS